MLEEERPRRRGSHNMLNEEEGSTLQRNYCVQSSELAHKEKRTNQSVKAGVQTKFPLCTFCSNEQV